LVVVVAALALLSGAVSAQRGPGRGPWQTATPASQGLSAADLQDAADETNDGVPGRVCYLVIKNGFIVHEEYYDRWDVNDTRAGWSTTKSHCSSLYGMAHQQGWADHDELVRDRTDYRNCNRDATFKHVLTMTGESSNINNPSFSYDTDGTNCLDTLSDFIDDNNPNRTSTETWKDNNWQEPLGMEHFEWVNYAGYLHCGYTSETTCRDLARAAQLWVNEGAWPGVGQMMSVEHIRDGRTHVYPGSGTEYGYTTWLDTRDPVDEEVHGFVGMYSQCAWISKEHEAIVVSMGDGDISGALCSRSWTNAREAIVSSDKKQNIRVLTEDEKEEERQFLANRTITSHTEILSYRQYIEDFPEKLTPYELKTYNEYLIAHGEKPLRLPKQQ